MILCQSVCLLFFYFNFVPVYDFDNNINIIIIIIVVAMCELRCRKSEGVGYAEGYPSTPGVKYWSGILAVF